MFKQTNFISAEGYVAPSCRPFFIDCENVFCNSLDKGGREAFGGFTDAGDDFFDE